MWVERDVYKFFWFKVAHPQVCGWRENSPPVIKFVPGIGALEGELGGTAGCLRGTRRWRKHIETQTGDNNPSHLRRAMRPALSSLAWPVLASHLLAFFLPTVRNVSLLIRWNLTLERLGECWFDVYNQSGQRFHDQTALSEAWKR